MPMALLVAGWWGEGGECRPWVGDHPRLLPAAFVGAGAIMDCLPFLHTGGARVTPVGGLSNFILSSPVIPSKFLIALSPLTWCFLVGKI